MANCIAFSSDDGTLASGSDDGTLKLWKAGASWQAVSLLALPSETEGGPDTVLQVLDEGYYSGSPGVDRTIRWRVGSDLFPADAYERTFNRPDLIRKALAGEAIPPAPEAQRFTMGQAIPPQVTIRTPRPGEELAGPAVNIEVVATDDRSVERIELLINGRLVGAKPIPAFAKPIPALAKPIPAWAKPIPASHTISREFQAFVPLPPGETVLTLKAIAYDDENLQSWEEVHLTRKASPVPGDLYVLAVGVSRYSNRDPKYQLKYAAADANAFADLWPRAEGKLFRKVHVTRILDEQATAVGIKEALVRITTQATERDTVGLFLSGHGLSVEDRDFYFASTEVDVNRPAETALPWTVLQSILAKMDARRVFLFLDACHSGNALGGQRANTERMAELLVKRAGVLVFASSRGSEYSYELDELRHGAFTQAIVEGLGEGKADLDLGAGKDGVVDVDELQAFLRRRVQQLTGNLQTPTCPLIRDFGDPFPLFRTR